MYSRHCNGTVRFLLPFHPRSCNYGAIMSLCDFSAFLRIPFSESDFLHYILKYVFEPFESRLLGVSLQKVPKKQRLRFQGLSDSFVTRSDGTSDCNSRKVRLQTRWDPHSSRSYDVVFCAHSQWLLLSPKKTILRRANSLSPNAFRFRHFRKLLRKPFLRKQVRKKRRNRPLHLYRLCVPIQPIPVPFNRSH